MRKSWSLRRSAIRSTPLRDVQENGGRGGRVLSGLLPAGGLLPLAPDANGRISGVQHSGIASPYESWLGYVFEKSRVEVCQGAGKIV